MYPISIFLHGFSTTRLRAVMGLPRRGGASPSKSTCIRFPFFCTVLLLHVYERSCVCLGRVEPTHLSTIGFHKQSIESRAAPMEHGHEVEQGARIKEEEGKKEDGGSRKEEGGMRKEEGWHDSRFRFGKKPVFLYTSANPCMSFYEAEYQQSTMLLPILGEQKISSSNFRAAAFGCHLCTQL